MYVLRIRENRDIPAIASDAFRASHRTSEARTETKHSKAKQSKAKQLSHVNSVMTTAISTHNP